jgi:pimeloyl-ACP methyl ester carboxylesterase
MNGSSLLSFVVATSLSIPVFAQECRLDYGQEDLNELRLGDAYQLSYLEYGSGEPVVLIHGALSDYRVWWHQIEDLRRNYRVIAPSLRAAFPNSLSRWPNTPAAAAWSDADDVIELIEHLAADRVHLIGHSAGGAVALNIAVRRPDLLRTLILEEPAVFTVEQPPETQSWFASIIEQIGRGEATAAVRDFINVVSGVGNFESQSDDCQQMLIANAATLSVRGVLAATTCATAGTVQAPVLYIQGEISPRRDSPFEECLPLHDSVTISEASHGVHIDKPREFNRAVRGFISRH